MADIVLLSIDRVFAERIEQAFEQRAKFRLVQQLVREDLPGAGVIVLDRAAIPQNRSLTSAVADTVAQAEGLPVVLACDTGDVAEVLAAIRAGAADVLPRDATSEEITLVLGRRLNAAIVGQSRRGALTLVLGPNAEAAAVLSTDIALSYAQEGRSTILVDCTIPKSACETYLDVKVSYGIASAVADMARLDASLLGNSLAQHRASGLMLLTLDGGAQAEPVGLSAHDVSSLVELLQACCSNVVFCVGNLRNAALLGSLVQMADTVEMVASQSIIELEALRRLLDAVDISPEDRARSRLLMWDHQPAVLLDGKRMGDVLGIGHTLGIPVDPVRIRNALNLGRPVMSDGERRDPYCQVVQAITGMSRGNGALSLMGRLSDVFGRGLQAGARA
jgi:pilus assembly protein CpaE